MADLNWDAAADRAGRLMRGPETGPGGALIGFDLEGTHVTHAFGRADLASNAPFTVDTICRYASVTKHVFCAFVLAHPDVIGLQDTLGQHLPQLQPALGEITVGQALSMSGGVPDTRECLTLIGHSVFTRTEAEDLLAFHAQMSRPSYAPGTEVHYSNGGYRLVEEAMRAHGLDFDTFLAEQLRDGFGLSLRASEYWTDPVPGLAPGYFRAEDGWKAGFQGMHLSAAGSLSGSVRDLARWGQILLTGEGRFEGVLPALSEPGVLKDGTRTGYGLGLRHQDLAGHALVGHGGSQPGYKTYLLLDPEQRAGVAVVANRDDLNTADIAQQVMAAALDIAALPRPGTTLVPGLYVAAEGADWLEIDGTSARRLDDDVTLYDVGGGESDSFSPTSRLRLRMEGQAIRGTVGHAPARFVPVVEEAAPPVHLDGLWHTPAFGAHAEIRDGAIIFGAGPTRRAMPLRPLGGGRYLFTLKDGPSTRRICLAETGEGRFDLALSRARTMEWRRLSD